MNLFEKDFIAILKNAVHASDALVQLAVTDWKAVFAVASNQNLLPIIYNVADGYSGFKKFDEAHPEYMMNTVRSLSRQVKNTAEFLSLYRNFINAGLSPIVVKGITCRLLYGDLQDFRPSGDEDILIDKKDFEAISAVCYSCGYKTKDATDKNLSAIQEVTFSNEDMGLTIELHLNPFGVDNQIRAKMNSWFKDSFSTTETIEVDGVKLRVLSPTNNLLFLLFHAFKHFLSAGMGIRMALDILLCMEKCQEHIDWEYLKDALEDVKATSFKSDLIAVGNKYLGFNLCIEGLNSSTSPDELLDDMLRMGAFGIGSQVDVDASRFTKATIEGKSNSKIADTLHLVFPSWDQWKGFHPYLVDKPWMLPVEWCKRVGRYLKKRDRVNFSESRKVADRRIELIKKYKVI